MRTRAASSMSAARRVICRCYNRRMDLTVEHIARVVSGVLADYDVREAYLFGSFARGEQGPTSDIDLRFLCGPNMTFGMLYEIAVDLERELGCRVEIVTNPPEHMRKAFRERVQRDEVLIYAAA